MSEQSFDQASRDELDSLLGAYVLDALEPEDRARVDAYLERDEQARAEVDDMRETAASLALAPAAIGAPPEIWERIAEVIAADDRSGDRAGDRSGDRVEGDELAARRARRTALRWIAPASAAAAIAIVVLAAQVASLHHQLDGARTPGTAAIATAFDRATKVAGAHEVALSAGTGPALARVVLLPDGTGYLRGEHLGALKPNETYQLWAAMGDARHPTMVSAGVLGSAPSAAAFHASGPVVGFALSIEKAGGAVRPSKAIAQGALA